MMLLIWLTFMFILCPAVLVTGVLMYSGRWTLPKSNMRKIRDAQTDLALAKLREKTVVQGTKIDAAEHARIEHALALPPPEEIARAQREKREQELAIREVDTDGENPVCECGHRSSQHRDWQGKLQGCDAQKTTLGFDHKYDKCDCTEFRERDDQPIEFDNEVEIEEVAFEEVQ